MTREDLAKITDQNILIEIAKNEDIEFLVQREAIVKITDQDLLINFAKNPGISSQLRRIAVEKITDPAVIDWLAENDKEFVVYNEAIKKVTDQAVFIRIAKNKNNHRLHARTSALAKITDVDTLIELSRDKMLRNAFSSRLLEKITDHSLLIKIAKNAEPCLADEALKKITDFAELEDITKTAQSHDVRKEAAYKADDPELYSWLATHNKLPDVRAFAVRRIADQEMRYNIVKTGHINAKHDESLRTFVIGVITDLNILERIATGGEEFICRGDERNTDIREIAKARLNKLHEEELARLDKLHEEELARQARQERRLQGITMTHEELQKNIPDLPGAYLYHEGYVYYSSSRSGARDAAGWLSGGEVFKRATDDGFEVTTFSGTYNQSVSTASSSHYYTYSVPELKDDGYVYFSIRYDRSNDWSEDETSWYNYKIKADGVSSIE